MSLIASMRRSGHTRLPRSERRFALIRVFTLPKWSTSRHIVPVIRHFLSAIALQRLPSVPHVSPLGHNRDIKWSTYASRLLTRETKICALIRHFFSGDGEILTLGTL